jgi:hypothetical protein
MVMLGVTSLLQVLLKGRQCLLCSSQIIGLQCTLQCLEILTDGTALPCLLGACDPSNTGTRRAIFLEGGKSLLCPLEIPRLERIGKTLKILLALFAIALDGGLVAIGACTYARKVIQHLCENRRIQETGLSLMVSDKCTKWTGYSPNCTMSFFREQQPSCSQTGSRAARLVRPSTKHRAYLSNAHCFHGQIRNHAPWVIASQIATPEGESEHSCSVYAS